MLCYNNQKIQKRLRVINKYIYVYIKTHKLLNYTNRLIGEGANAHFSKTEMKNINITRKNYCNKLSLW